MTGKILTPIVDKNGKNTKVWKNDGDATKTRIKNSLPTSAALAPKLTPSEELVKEINSSGKKFSLHYVGQGEGLQKEQISKYLAGDDELEADLDDIFSDQHYDYAIEEAKSACAEKGVDWDELDTDEQDEIRFAIGENDDGDLMKDLLRQTPNQLMRAKLTDNILTAVHDYASSHETEDFETGDEKSFGDDFVSVARNGHNDRATEARVLALQELLGDRGFDVTSEKAIDSLNELVENGPFDWHEGVTAEIIWYGDVSSANVGEWIDGEKKTERNLDFGDSAYVLLLDKWNGSGHDVELTGGSINATVSSMNPAILDSDSDGYGWDQVAGVHKPAYKNDVNSAWT